MVAHLVLTVLMVVAPAGVGQQDSQQFRIQRAAQNPVLQRHFRERVRKQQKTNGLLSNRQPTLSTDWLDRDARSLTRIFVRRLDRQLSSFSESHERVLRLREELVEAGSASQRSRALKDWKQGLRQLSNASERLRKTVYPVLRSVNVSSPRLPGPSRPSKDVFLKEVGILSSRVTAATQRIDAFFFSTSHTVSVEAYSSNTILSVLRDVEELSRSIADLL